MTRPVVPPLIPPMALGGPDDVGPPLTIRATSSSGAPPLPQLRRTRSRPTQYGFATVDQHGTITARGLLVALGWNGGTPLEIREHFGLVIITATHRGPSALTSWGHLRIPAAIRHQCSLKPGVKVLLSAEPDQGVLTMHPPAVLDTMITWLHSYAFGGEEP